jgi:hypothetical protein
LLIRKRRCFRMQDIGHYATCCLTTTLQKPTWLIVDGFGHVG